MADANTLLTGAEHLTRSADEYENDGVVESLWVAKACTYADVHMKLIASFNPSLLNLTRHDSRIFDLFKVQFPDFEVEDTTIESLKSPAAKEKWRLFCEELKDVEDYNYGTLLRLNCRDDYNEGNTILVTRVQFLAIEISRNRGGLNEYVWKLHTEAKKVAAEKNAAAQNNVEVEKKSESEKKAEGDTKTEAEEKKEASSD